MDGDALPRRGPFSEKTRDLNATGYFQALNLHKRNVFAEDAALASLIDGADIVIHDPSSSDTSKADARLPLWGSRSAGITTFAEDCAPL